MPTDTAARRAQTVLVTGGAGFIGSHVTEALLARGDTVVVLDNFDDFYDPALKRANLAAAHGERFRLIEGDIRSAADLAVAFSGLSYDAVVHLAARAGVRPSLADPALYADVNVTGTARLLEHAGRHDVPYVVYGSSSSVYGSTTEVPFRESSAADRPASPYAATKRAGELLCYADHALTGRPVTSLRFFTVYGPRQRPEMAIHRFTRRLSSGNEVTVFGDGSARRDFTYVNDIVAGVLAALDHPNGYSVYNLGTTATTTLIDLVHLVASTLGVPARIRFEPDQPGDVPITYADINLARAQLGYEPQTTLAGGIAAFVEWFRRRTPAQDRERAPE